MAILLTGLPNCALAQGGPARPPVGDVASLPDALLVYSVRGTASASPEKFTAWIAVEGTVYWDSYKRMIAALDRETGRKITVALDVRGRSDLRAAMSLGKIVRERGLDVTVGRTVIDPCRNMLSEADCVAIKRSGGPLLALLGPLDTCDTACVLILAGGIRRSLADSTTVVLNGTQVGHRTGLNIPDEIRDGVHVRANEQIKLYLTQMGVDAALADMIDANYGTAGRTVLTRADLVRLRVVTQ